MATATKKKPSSTGVNIQPKADPPFSGTVARRLQIHVDDLNEPGATYIVEGHYIAADDAAAGNANNNASYREINVSAGGNDRSFSLAGSTGLSR